MSSKTRECAKLYRYTSSLLEQIGMRAGTHEHDRAMFHIVIEFVGQQKIAADMALPMAFPVAANG